MKYLLDTNILIYLLQEELSLEIDKYYVSFVSELELLSFELSKDEEKIIKSFLKNFKIVNINNKIKEITIDIRRKTKLKLPDSIVLATAKYKRAILVTNDKQILKSSSDVINYEEFKVKEIDEIK